jgi:nifR3 family TIM-barrel protein
MANCPDLPFRLIAREKGMKFAFLEMISAEALLRDNRTTAELLTTTPEDRPLGAQLVGCNPESMGKAARLIEEMGFDWLDLNLGCPVPKVTGNGGGSALLREPDTAREIFVNVVRKIKKIPVTVKMRLGYSDTTGSEACAIAKLAENAGFDAVSVHGRTRAQGYSGRADYEAIARVKETVKIPVFGNGDVTNAESARKLCAVAAVDGVMIGRGALGNPWIYREVESALNGGPIPDSPGFEEKKRTLLRHMELEVRFHERTALFRMRRVACWYFKDMPGAAELRARINITPTLSELGSLLENFSPN